VAKEFVLPDIGEGLVDAEIVQWHVAVGDEVTEEQVLVEVETAKAVVELPSPYAGTILSLAAAEGETVAVGDALVVIGDAGEIVTEPPAVPDGDTGPEVDQVATAPIADERSVRAMPVVRRLARDHGIDLADVIPSGPGGRITREDVEALIEETTEAAVTSASPTPPTSTGDQRVPMARVRRAVAAHMAKSWSEIPHVTVFDRVNGRRLLEARAALSQRLGRKIPLEAFVVKAVAPVLREFPEFNATLEGDDLVLRAACNVAVAVDTPDGLIVPVVHQADEGSIRELADRIDHLATAVRDRTATLDDLTGGTFTVSNIGALGGGFGTPIIPHGTTAILSVGRAIVSPVVEDGGSIGTAPLIPLSLSYDHRVIDGGLGQRFFARLMENLEEPALFMA
jgi:pyruvate dehydrogenase E2 component (dihydrolipoamide acetyltransferase)